MLKHLIIYNKIRNININNYNLGIFMYFKQNSITHLELSNMRSYLTTINNSNSKLNSYLTLNLLLNKNNHNSKLSKICEWNIKNIDEAKSIINYINEQPREIVVSELYLLIEHLKNNDIADLYNYLISNKVYNHISVKFTLTKISNETNDKFSIELNKYDDILILLNILITE